MKKITLLAAAAAMALPVAASEKTPAHVTVYGIADGGYVRVSNVNGRSRQGIDSGWLQPSRLGFRGQEDLGGGLSAVFTLETGYNLDTGANTSATTFFNRQAFVGLASKRLGSLNLGRQYTLIFDNLLPLSGMPAFGFSGGAVDGLALPGSSAGRFDNTLGGTRIDNAIKYTSYVVSGLQWNAMTGWGEVSGSHSAKQLWALGAKYRQGPIYMGMSYQTKACALEQGCTTTQDKDKTFAIGGSYDLSLAKLSVIFTRQNNAKNVKHVDGDTLQLMVQVPVNTGLLSVGYQTLNDRSAAHQDVDQYNISFIKFLSKRTSVYAAFSAQKVSHGGHASLAMTKSSNHKQNAFAVGLRNTF